MQSSSVGPLRLFIISPISAIPSCNLDFARHWNHVTANKLWPNTKTCLSLGCPEETQRLFNKHEERKGKLEWREYLSNSTKKGPKWFRNCRQGFVAVKATMQPATPLCLHLWLNMNIWMNVRKNVPYKQFTGKPRRISFLGAFWMPLKRVCCCPTRFQQWTTKGCLLAKKDMNPIFNKCFLKSLWYATCPLEYLCQTGISEILGIFWANWAQYWPFLWALHPVYLNTSWKHQALLLLLHYIYCLFSFLYFDGVKLVPPWHLRRILHVPQHIF